MSERRPLEKKTELDETKKDQARTTAPSPEPDLLDSQATSHDGSPRSQGKTQARIAPREIATKARKGEKNPHKNTEESGHDIELSIEDIQDATEEETKSVLLKEARIAANNVTPDLYIGKEVRDTRAKTVNQELERLGLELAKAKLKDKKDTINALEEQRVPLQAESDRLSRFATAEEELAARITEMEALRDKLKAQKKRISPIEAALADLREVQAHLTEAVTWEDPKKAAKLRRDRAYEELRLRKFREDAHKEFEASKKAYQDQINQQGRSSEAIKQRKGLTLIERLEKNLWDLSLVFKKKYGFDIEKAYTKTETVGERAYSWWRDTRIGKALSREPELYGERDRNKQSMLESYKKLTALYKSELEVDYTAEERQKKAEGKAIITPLEREKERVASLVKKVISPRVDIARELIRPLAEMAAMPVLAIAEPILRERKWAKEWNEINSRREGPLAAELVNEIARSVVNNEDALQYVAEIMKISPDKLEVSDVAEFFYITEEGEKLREELMKKLRKEIDQKKATT